MAMTSGLAALEARLHHDLELLANPADNWVIPRQAPGDGAVIDVLVIGGGMCGLCASFALLRLGVRNLRIVDASAAGREGPWLSYARMQTLRSPKHLAGPALGLPSLTFRAWYEAQWGRQAWDALGRIPRPMWMDYLCWYRKVLRLPVENNTRAESIVPCDVGYRVELCNRNNRELVYARKIVLATGREGLARPRIPPAFESVSDAFYQHSSASIDFEQLRGRDVAVIGLGASAFDNAGSALEAGAARVTLLGRAATMPTINKAKSIVYAGFTEGFPRLGPAKRLRALNYIFESRIPAPRDSVLRVFRHANASLQLGAAVTRVQQDGDRLDLHTRIGVTTVDNVILGTGFRIDLFAAPEIAPLASDIATIRDQLTAETITGESELFDFPWLGDGFEFIEKAVGQAPWLSDLHCFNFAAMVSHGNVSGDIPAVSEGAQRLARAIARQLFVADAEGYWQRLQAYSEAELQGNEWPGAQS